MWTRRSPVAGDHNERICFPQPASLLPVADSTVATSAVAATGAPCVNGNEYSWEERTFAQLYPCSGDDLACVWPPRSYSCSFCGREFRSAQALGGHMNIHRRDRARLRALSPSRASVSTCSTSCSATPQAADFLHQRYQRSHPNTSHETNVPNPSIGHDFDGVLSVSTPRRFSTLNISSQPSSSGTAIAAVAPPQEQNQHKRSFSLMLRPLQVPDLKLGVDEVNQGCGRSFCWKEREEEGAEQEEIKLHNRISNSKRQRSEDSNRSHPYGDVLPFLASLDSVDCRQCPLRHEIMLELGQRRTVEKLDLELRLGDRPN